MAKELENLSSDILDDDMVKIFEALHFQQRILGTLRVNINNGFATAPTKIYNYYIFFFWSIIGLMYSYFINECEIEDGVLIEKIYLKLALLMDFAIIVAIVLRNMLQKNKYYLIYVKIQKLDRNLQIKYKKINRYMFIFNSCFSVFGSIFGLSWVFLFHYNVIKGACLADFAILLPGMASAVDVTLILVIIFFVIIRVRHINIKLKDMNRKQSKIHLCDSESLTNENIVWNNLLNGMDTILAIIDDFNELFQCQIFFFTCQVVSWSIILIQCVILTLKNQISVTETVGISLPQISVSSTPAMLTMSIVIVLLSFFIALCFLTQYLTSHLLMVKKKCIEMMSSANNDTNRCNAKRMLLLINAKSDLSVFGMFTLNIDLPVQVLAIITTYTIVLLQFDLV